MKGGNPVNQVGRNPSANRSGARALIQKKVMLEAPSPSSITFHLSLIPSYPSPPPASAQGSAFKKTTYFFKLPRLDKEIAKLSALLPKIALQQYINKCLIDEMFLSEIREEDPKDGPDGQIFRKDHVDVVSATQRVIHHGAYSRADYGLSSFIHNKRK